MLYSVHTTLKIRSSFLFVLLNIYVPVYIDRVRGVDGVWGWGGWGVGVGCKVL